MTIPIPRNKFGGYEDMLNLSQASAADADGDASGQDVHAETLALTLPASMGAPSTISSATATPSLPSGRAAPHPIVLIDSDDEGASTDSLELADDGTELAPCPIDPNCTARMRVPPTAALQKAIEEYRRCERRFARGRIQREQLMQARLRVCRLHASEVSVIPRGIEQGYPAEIDLRRVRERVEAMRSVFVDILRGRVASPFLEATLASFRNLGVWKAQANETRFSRLSKLQCGYYGWKGGNIIFKTIQALFRGPNAELRKSTTEPQSVVDYIQNVLVPEAALRLIAGDYAIDLSSPSGMRRARGIMDDSAEFGACVNGSVSDSDDSGSASESGHESE
ncbi:hypothetical protein HK105_206666 [Polyrhizophydium stewartii]|uniref:Restriction of telomere capping protein 4 n=1 Tax=Polyrhizophydium stewartii TaxID=2732419 RepID=A0ABR4N2Q9_9FUNG